jgi:hypothetical protein
MNKLAKHVHSRLAHKFAHLYWVTIEGSSVAHVIRPRSNSNTVCLLPAVRAAAKGWTKPECEECLMILDLEEP